MNQGLALLDSEGFLQFFLGSILFLLLLLFFAVLFSLCCYLTFLLIEKIWQVYMSITSIPPKKQDAGDPPKKFLTQVKTSEYLALQKEAADRGLDILSLSGIVLSVWLASGCPLSFQVDGEAGQ
ncbi:hypothetical protein SA496_21355 [Pseudomonas sp. JS3066]|uniref:hypothetical protein n=1 Tax=Pseudomonas sp. JS3066 TaxID=3090665 RepID=UPI002E7AF53D|nr:hypothetical protein [Pseudomonas sp. JS3066]WVK92249.1 hypothetical protein SA496_21355 [Pseudomonas sp. JS3066]